MTASGSARHRFVGRVGDLCKENFGGKAACALSYGASLHYNDQDHPYQEGSDAERAGECSWILQNDPREFAHFCAADKDDPAHAQTEVVEIGLADTARIHVDWTTRTDKPQGDDPHINEPVVADWRDAKIRPPDEDQIPADFGQPKTAADKIMEALAEEAGQYAWEQGRLGGEDFFPGKPEKAFERGTAADGYPYEEWARAVLWLESDDVELTYGPWPVRKYLLQDGRLETTYRPLERCVKGLEELDMVYQVQVTRPVGCGWRVALVTWDWAYGLQVPSIGDELAARYGG